MPYDRFLIAPFQEGEETRTRPWLIPDKAFEQLRNMYVWRQRLRKRFGATVMDTTQASADQQLFTRLRINIGTTAAVTGNLGATIVPGTVFKVGQMFSIGTTKFTVYQNGAMYSTGAATGTYNTATGSVVITGNTENPSTAVYFYPAEPVMHFGIYETDVTNNETTIAFDTQFAYTYTSGSGWSRFTGGAAANVWTTDADKDFYYWSTSFQGPTADTYYFYITNNVIADAMRFYDGTNWNAWGSFATTPLDAVADYITTAKVIVPFQGRLLLLNTTEFTTAANALFKNRIRFSGPASVVDPSGATAWLIASKAGFIDLPTKEAIISAEMVKDVLIIECERSTWRLSATGNELEPFIYDQIDSELGVESVNSMVSLDKITIGFGSSGIHACDGQTVQRVDEKIPDIIYDVSNTNSNHRRVQGVRDFFAEMLYWTFNSVAAQTTYNLVWPNRLMVYDYINQTYAFNDDSISALGYFWRQAAQSSRQIAFRTVIGGNQQGWTFLTDIDVFRNSASLQITDVATPGGNIIGLTIEDHNLTNGSYIYIDNIQTDTAGFTTQLNGIIRQVTTTATNTLTFDLGAVPVGGTYEGCGTVERVSEPNVLTKAFNFYQPKLSQVAFQRVNFYVDSTTAGEFTVDFIPSASSVSLLTDATASGALIGNNILDTVPFTTLIPLEAFQERFWHAVTFSATGETVQLRLYLTDDQLTVVRTISMVDYNIPFENIVINAMAFYVAKTQEMA